MGLMDFYLCSNSIRELVLSLCKLSKQVFEISLNSSLVTDELSSLGADLKSYAIYSEKMNLISNSLGTCSREMLKHSTRVMELSLEKTKFNTRIIKLREAEALINQKVNKDVLEASIKNLESKLQPLDTDANDVIGMLDSDLRNFNFEIKKLWLLATNLKTHSEFDEIAYLHNIILKIETTLHKIDETTANLNSQLAKLERNI
ncbi:MAG: hypothetical protein AB7I27_02305 [Bacteriovoracaceae bacterium]